MKILITGGSGYIGRTLTKALRGRGYEVHSPSSSLLNLNNFDSVEEYFKDKYFDVVLHCAIVGGNRLIEDKVDVLDLNLTMYYNLIKFSQCWDKFINFGSGAEVCPNTYYGLSKNIINKSILYKPNSYNIRLYGVFDENELSQRFIKSCLINYIDKKPMIIEDKKMSFFYMKDLITLVDYYIKTPSSKLLKECECSYVNSTSLLDIANFINTLDSHKVPIYLNCVREIDYEAKYNAPYEFNYLGLKKGIEEVYEKLKIKNKNEEV
jgi:UDP-glucose 4-epimerase